MYPDPLKAVIRNLTDNVVIASTPFKRMNALNFGARMSLFYYDNEVIVWSAIPYGDEVIRSLKQLTGEEENFNVTHIIIPDAVHSMAVESFRKAYPNIKVIGMNSVKVKLDYVIDNKLSYQLIGKPELNQLGITSNAILNNFEFVYLPSHQNKELVMFDKTSKLLFEADLILNLGPYGTKLEQYSPELGFKPSFNPHAGLSYLTRHSHPDSKFYKGMVNKFVHSDTPEVKKALKIIYDWDFSQIIPCHGNVVEDGKPFLKKYFDFL